MCIRDRSIVVKDRHFGLSIGARCPLPQTIGKVSANLPQAEMSLFNSSRPRSNRLANNNSNNVDSGYKSLGNSCKNISRENIFLNMNIYKVQWTK